MEYILILLVGAGIVYYFYQNKRKTELAVAKAAKEWADKPGHNWKTVDFAAKRQQQDPRADALIGKLFASKNALHLNKFYEAIQRTSTELPEELPEDIKAYFEEGDRLPEWANQDLIKRGEEFYIEHGGMIALVLCAKSLPECYACANGAMVLYKTCRLSEQNGSLNAFTRRIAETAQFIVNTMSPGGLSPGGLGIRSAQKVRLIHATIRHYLHKGEWDAAKYGEPINQQDMAGTLMSFSPLVIQGLEKLGVNISNEEKEAYSHCWRIIGHFMGLDEDVLPNNMQDALNLGNTIFDDQKEASDEGKKLTASLIDFMTLMSENGEIHIIVDDLLRMLIGDDTADMIGVPPVSQKEEYKANQIAREFLGGWENFIERHSILRALARPINKIFLNGMLRVMNKGEKIHFFIPPSLQKDWGVGPENNS